MKILQQIEIDLRSGHDLLTIYIDVWDNSLGHKWLSALNELLRHDYHLEKNYCFLRNRDLIIAHERQSRRGHVVFDVHRTSQPPRHAKNGLATYGSRNLQHQ